MRSAKTTLTAVILLGGSIAALRALAGPSTQTPAGPEPEAALLGPRAEGPSVPEPVAAAPLAPAPEPVAAPSGTPKLRTTTLRAPTRPAAPRRTRQVAVTVAKESGQAQVYVDPYEITVAQYKTCMDAGACKADDVTVQADSPCNYGAPERGDHPMNCVSWNGADAYCRFTGAHLCKEEEWFAGCRGPSGQDYPYGASYVEGACRAEPREGLSIAEIRTAPVGGSPGCEGGYPGLWDMAGNVSEWVDSCTGDYCHFYGGAFLENDPAGDFASCKRMCAGNQKVFRSSTVGFRCCSDTPRK
jgi:formylglycine-generating enzyme required for sulfatase activity